MKLNQKRKGSAWVWFAFLILVFMIIIVYNSFSYVLVNFEPQMRSYINTTTNSSDSTIGTNALQTIDILDTMWRYWPAFLLFGLLIWVFVSAVKREPVYETG